MNHPAPVLHGDPSRGDKKRTAKEWRNRTLISRERIDSRFLVLTGSEYISTEITEYKYFSLILTQVEFKYYSD